MVRLVVALALAASSARAQPAPQLVDLTSSLAPLQREHAAHDREARFVALLSPT